MYGKRIKELRLKAGLNQADLAQMIGISRPNISFWEKAEFPPLEAISKVCKALGLKTWEFFVTENTLAELVNIPTKYIDILYAIMELDKVSQDDILDILKILILKYQKVSTTIHKIEDVPLNHTETTIFNKNRKEMPVDKYSLSFNARNAGNIALESYFD